MSVIHEAVKRAREVRSDKTNSVSGGNAAPDLRVRAVSPRVPGRALVWLMLFFVLAEAGFYFWESQKRHRAEEKLQQAYLELNDVRGNYLGVQKGKLEAESKLTLEIAALQKKLSAALTSKSEALAAKQTLEFDLLAKEKLISKMTKEKHEIEMDKFRLQDELKTLQQPSDISQKS